MKRPSFQFYPADWRSDAGLKLCSLQARGLWIEMICIMHAAEPYGHLCAAGRPLDARDLARLVGESERDVKRMLDELTRNNVCSLSDGAFVSRRMVRDEALRDVRANGGKAGSEFGHLGAEHGKKGGRPRKTTGDKKPPLNPPPSSSSSSSSSNTPSPPNGAFEDFWECWPQNDRKQDRGKCLAKWEREGLDALGDTILADVKAKKLSQKWREGFVEAPIVYLNNRRWEDGAGTTAPGPKRGSDEYAALHRDAAWWREAGFPSVYDAIANRCWHTNAHQFRDGKRVEVAA